MTSKVFKSLLIIAIIASTSISPLMGQSNQPVKFNTDDNLLITGILDIPDEAEGSLPAIILIHQGGSSKSEWKNLKLWNNLKKAGFIVLAYDIRTHGQSGKDKGSLSDLFNNPKRSPLDLQAAIDFLKKEERVDHNRIGVLGASIGANLACVAASSDLYPVQSVVSISAKVSAVQNLSGTKSPLSFKNAFFVASEEEQNGLRKKWANDLFNRTKGSRKIKIASGESHGSYILRDNEKIQQEIITWFKDTL